MARVQLLPLTPELRKPQPRSALTHESGPVKLGLSQVHLELGPVVFHLDVMGNTWKTLGSFSKTQAIPRPNYS